MTVAALLRCSHPEPVVAVTAASAALAWSAGRGARSSATAAAAVLAGQLCVGWTNDVLDLPRDRLAGRTDKPLVLGTVQRSTVARAAALAAVACVPLSLANGSRAGAVHLGAVGVALAYDAGLKDTAASALPYAAAFAALPAFLTLGAARSRRPSARLSLAGAMLGVGAHFLQVLPDIRDDRRAGSRGLPQRLGERASLAVGAAGMGAAAAVIAGRPGATRGRRRAELAAASVPWLSLVAAGVTGRPRLAFRCSLLTGACVVGGVLHSGERL